jgi:ABC-type Fe3+-hydroxamate transport system substrate-binding protein
MRRAFLVILAALLTVSAATACSAEQAPPASPSYGGGSGAFPVTIEHKFGSTTIPERPDRVLSLGYQEHDAIFALGVTPIAVRYWYGDESDVIFPWATAVREAHPEWEGQTVAVAVLAEDGQFSTFASEDPRSRFFTSLGCQVPAQIDELAGDRFYVDVSAERIGLFDTELLVWDQLQYLPNGRTTIEANQVGPAARGDPAGSRNLPRGRS